MTTIAANRTETPPDAKAARAALAAEWEALSPSTPSEVAAFYRDSKCLGADLEAFHTHPDRLKWTEILVHLAKNVAGPDPESPGAVSAIDIGCGAGHDLRALKDAGVADVYGVEPNDDLRYELVEAGFHVRWTVDDVPVETADLLSCFDVLEHVVDPESFLGGIAKRAKIGAVLVETCATHDTNTPLHLQANRGWHPGRVLEQHGWERIGESERVRIWRRHATEAPTTTGLIVCAYRSISLPTVSSILKLLDSPLHPDPYGWRVSLSGEAGINRSRSIMASRWWRETADDVFIMLDDDIIFEPKDAEKLAEKCRSGYDVICGAYPVRDGGHMALRGYGEGLEFHEDLEPVEIKYASTGFLAVHRRVLDKILPTLTLCHENQTWAFWPCFDFKVVEDRDSGGHNYLSEDWNFSQMARDAGFKVWLDPSIRLGHIGQVVLNVSNMSAIYKIVTGKETSNGQGH